MSAIQEKVPANMLGRVMSFCLALINAALPIGILLYGYLYEKFINHLPLIMFATAICIFTVGQIGKKTYRNLSIFLFIRTLKMFVGFLGQKYARLI